MYSYELDIMLGTAVGALTASSIRDEVESLMAEAIMDDETIEVEMVSEQEFKVRLNTPFDLIGNDAGVLEDAIREALLESLAYGAASVGCFQMTDGPRPAFLH